MDKFKYKLPYESKKKHFKTILVIFFSEYFGGVSSISVNQFRQVNGFSNQYWGWGGEDDDFYIRVIKNKLKLTRYNASLARWVSCCVDSISGLLLRYTMIKHNRDKTNKPNPDRFKLIKSSEKFHKTDGLNNLK